MAPESSPVSGQLPTVRKSPKRWIVWVVALLVVTLILAAIGLFSWYKQSLQPRDPKAEIKVHVSVQPGQTNSQIAAQLEEKGIIKSALGFEWYVRLEKPSSSLQAGRYALSPRMPVSEVVKHLESGKTDLFMITILPGNTLEEIKKTLQKYGYSAKEINDAFHRRYTHPLLADLPPGQDLEGYIYPETYEVQSSTTLATLFTRDFGTLYNRLKTDGLIEQFKSRGLNLHQALTLASIVQKETSVPEEQRKVAQVFYNRISKDMKLESDTTFIYAAEKLGIEPRVDIDSPYNTRLYAGLPPGPIANMEYSALQAVAHPTLHDFLYFVAGDDGVIYYSHTLEEHESNVQKYCHTLCN